MKGPLRLSLAVFFAAMLFSVVTAIAQPLAWNPPCAGLRVKDVTGGTVSVNVVTTPPGLVGTLTAPPFGASPTVPMPAGSTVNGIISAGGIFYGVVQPGPPSPPAPFAANGWISNVSLAPGGCVDLYLDLLNCTIYVFPTASAPPCNP